MRDPKLSFGYSKQYKVVRLSEIATPNARIGWQNLRRSEFMDSGDVYIITGTDFENGIVNFKGCKFVAPERYEMDDKIKVHEGDILITKDGTIGKVAIVKGLDRKATLNAGVFVLNDINQEVCHEYLYHYLRSPKLLKFINTSSTGGTILHLNQSVLLNFPVTLPSLGEQQKIAAFFTMLDRKIELETKKVSKYKQAKKAIFQKILSDALFENCPLKMEKISSVANAITGYPFDSSKFQEHGIRLVKGANVKRGSLDFSPEITSFWANCDNLEKFVLQKGDLLIQMDGAQVGKSFGFVEQDLLPALLVQRVTRLRCNESVANVLYQYLDHGYFDSYIKKRMTNTAVPHISLSDIKDFEFMIPEREESLKKMSCLFRLLESKIKIIECRRKVLIRQKQAFMQQMLV